MSTLERAGWDFESVAAVAAGARPLKPWLDAWLRQWETVTAVNGYSLGPRSTQRLRSIWPSRAGSAPFRLMAIVFRPDLRSTTPPSAGEGRFVFGAFDPVTAAPLEFSVIWEFGLPGSLESWVRDLERLSAATAQDYPVVLDSLVARFLRRDRLLQVRTNDFLFQFDWEMREFAVDPASGALIQRETQQTPDFSFSSGTPSLRLASWLRDNSAAFASGQGARIPPEFLGGSAPLPEDSFRWLESSPLPEAVRKTFSMQTCNGCHGGDSLTNFMHLFPRYAGYPARMSRFLTDDLVARKADLDGLICDLKSGTRAISRARATATGRVH